VGTRADRLKPTGQRGALLTATLWLAAFAMVAWIAEVDWRWLALFAAGAAVFGALWAFRLRHPAQSVNPAEPGFLLGLAHKLRTSGPAVTAYRFAAEKAAPVACLAFAAVAVLFFGNRTAFDLSSAGSMCSGQLRP
jgi:hypothetical protein